MNVSPVASSDKVQSALTNLGIPDGFVANDVVPLLQQLVVALGNVTSGGGGGSAVWGDITGTLSNQTDLQNALDAKSGIITTPAIIYVETSGNDSTAVIGRPDLPFQTAQAAYDAGVVFNDNFVLQLGVGSFSITLDANFTGLCRQITGAGGGNNEVGVVAATFLTISGQPPAVTDQIGTNGFDVVTRAENIYLTISTTGGDVSDVTDGNTYTAGSGGYISITGNAFYNLYSTGGSGLAATNGVINAGSGAAINLNGGSVAQGGTIGSGPGSEAGGGLLGAKGPLTAVFADLRNGVYLQNVLNVTAGSCAVSHLATINNDKGGNSIW